MNIMDSLPKVIRLELLVTDPFDGQTRTFDDTYEFDRTQDPRYPVIAHQMYGDVKGTLAMMDTSFEALEKSLVAQLAKKGEFWIKSRREERAAVEADKAFKERVLPNLITMFPVDDWQFLHQVVKTAVENDGMTAVDQMAHAVKLDGSLPMAKVKATIRSALTAGKAHARTEYPDVYADEDDKDDFYDSYISDVANGFLGAL